MITSIDVDIVVEDIENIEETPEQVILKVINKISVPKSPNSGFLPNSPKNANLMEPEDSKKFVYESRDDQKVDTINVLMKKLIKKKSSVSGLSLPSPKNFKAPEDNIKIDAIDLLMKALQNDLNSKINLINRFINEMENKNSSIVSAINTIIDINGKNRIYSQDLLTAKIRQHIEKESVIVHELNYWIDKNYSRFDIDSIVAEGLMPNMTTLSKRQSQLKSQSKLKKVATKVVTQLRVLNTLVEIGKTRSKSALLLLSPNNKPENDNLIETPQSPSQLMKNGQKLNLFCLKMDTYKKTKFVIGVALIVGFLMFILKLNDK